MFRLELGNNINTQLLLLRGSRDFALESAVMYANLRAPTINSKAFEGES